MWIYYKYLLEEWYFLGRYRNEIDHIGHYAIYLTNGAYWYRLVNQHPDDADWYDKAWLEKELYFYGKNKYGADNK